jgi:hypothetical protein
MPSRRAKRGTTSPIATTPEAAGFLALFESVRARPGMYLPEATFGAAAAWVEGYDRACNGGVLAGFREWLIVRASGGNNLAWFALVQDVAFPQSRAPQAETTKSPASEKHAIDVMFGLIAEFWMKRAELDGLLAIYREYDHWLRRQSWYRAPTTKRRKTARASVRGRRARRS